MARSVARRVAGRVLGLACLLRGPRMNFNDQTRSCHAEPFAVLRVNSAKHLVRRKPRSFAALRMTNLYRS